MTYNVKKKIKQERSRTYINKDFTNLRSELLQYSRAYFSNNIFSF